MSVLEEMAVPRSAGNREGAPAGRGAANQPIAIYQVHLPSWMRVPEEQNRPLTFPEIAPKLAEHAKRMHFTHVQLHSIGHARARELGFLIEHVQQQDLGVILETGQPLQTLTAGDLNDPFADGLCAEGETLVDDQAYRWNREWAEETLTYFSTDPLYRKFRHAQFTRREAYAFDTNYILPLSDQLITPPRPSLWAMMPGDPWRKFANLRLLFAYQYLSPGKKLVFMGDEFGQPNPWRSETSLDWHVVHEYGHGKLMDWVGNLNRFYREERVLHTDLNAAGFQWIDTADTEASVASFLRRDAGTREGLLVVLNFTPVVRHNYRVGVPHGGFWAEILNSDAQEFGGSGQGNLGGVEAAPFGWNFQSHSLMLTLPPLAAIVLKATWVA
jgi:1,4-alpha-glucan branching enzyme